MNSSLPPGWAIGKSCVVTKHLDDFRYAEVAYDDDRHQYILSEIDCDGPTRKKEIGRYEDLGKAMKQGDTL